MIRARKTTHSTLMYIGPVHEGTRAVRDLKTVVVRRLECLRCHMGKRRNFPQSVEGNDSRVCADESRDASRLRVQGGRKMRLADSPRFSRLRCRKVLKRHCAADLTLRSGGRERWANSFQYRAKEILILAFAACPAWRGYFINSSRHTHGQR